MKAKEYAQKYIPLFAECKLDKEKELVVMTALFKEFMAEVDELRHTRNIIKKASIVSLLNEGSQKWRAMAALFPGQEIKPDGFRDVWAQKIPDVAKELR